MVDQKTYVGRTVRGQRVAQQPDGRPAACAQIVHRRLEADAELAIDDSDLGTDPYNCTGRFTVLKRD